MDRNRKAQWVAALRSGEYPQGYGALWNNKGYCCLGVLTDLAVKAGIGTWIVPPNDPKGYVYEDVEGIGWTAYLPTEVKAWADMSGGRMEDTIEALMVMNDSDQMSFADIADYIENTQDL